GLAFTHQDDGTTTLSGPLADQAALHGVLNRMRDLNVPIVSVQRVAAEAAIPATMHAIVQDKYGSADVLQLREIDTPTIGDDDVLVRVRAASVHLGDVHIMTGTPTLMRYIGFGLHGPKARVRGTDVAGTVAAVGKNVTQFQVGDDVFGTCDGAYAEYARARVDRLVLKPANITFEQASAVATSAVVARQAVRKHGNVQPGQKVLIVGASGGVGLFAVQIARALGAEVTGVGSTAKLSLMQSAGAEHVIDYTREDFTQNGQRYDVIVDIGGIRSLSQLRRSLTPKGTLVLVGGEGGNGLLGGALVRNLRATLLAPFVSQRLRSMLGLVNLPDLQSVQDMIAAGKITPIVDRTYPLAEAPAAVRTLHAGRAHGKQVITI
ncbi:MAG TPA: NAD(P)-dependent alcohol dehydrogenase, partial [Chloroflexota bacterium]|nr:NAD(P)-dependent alcohol dehydrogenase [Chloroflexota bacterium]